MIYYCGKVHYIEVAQNKKTYSSNHHIDSIESNFYHCQRIFIFLLFQVQLKLLGEEIDKDKKTAQNNVMKRKTLKQQNLVVTVFFYDYSEFLDVRELQWKMLTNG